jgi:hypothetical protein
MINGEFLPMFVHFNLETIQQIVNGNDKLLRPAYDDYERSFAETGKKLEDFIPLLAQWKERNFFIDLKRRTLLRSRFKKFLFSLSQKL